MTLDPGDAVRNRDSKPVEIAASRSRHDLGDALRGIGPPDGILRREAFVVVVVTIENEVDAAVIEYLPHGLERRVGAMPPGAESRVVPHGHGTELLRALEFGAQPVVLILPLRVRESRVDDDFANDHQHMPFTHVVAVITLLGIASLHSEVIE